MLKKSKIFLLVVMMFDGMISNVFAMTAEEIEQKKQQINTVIEKLKVPMQNANKVFGEMEEEHSKIEQQLTEGYNATILGYVRKGLREGRKKLEEMRAMIESVSVKSASIADMDSIQEVMSKLREISTISNQIKDIVNQVGHDLNNLLLPHDPLADLIQVLEDLKSNLLKLGARMKRWSS